MKKAQKINKTRKQEILRRKTHSSSKLPLIVSNFSSFSLTENARKLVKLKNIYTTCCFSMYTRGSFYEVAFDMNDA
jgi:hypothetical protein